MATSSLGYINASSKTAYFSDNLKSQCLLSYKSPGGAPTVFQLLDTKYINLGDFNKSSILVGIEHRTEIYSA